MLFAYMIYTMAHGMEHLFMMSRYYIRPESVGFLYGVDQRCRRISVWSTILGAKEVN